MLPIHFMKPYTLNSKGRMLVIDQPVVMGIINTTPDSFYSNSRQADLKSILHTADQMLSDGAGILDIGGMSTRPGSSLVTEQEEITRVLPAIEQIKKYFPQSFLSIDTYRSKVATLAVEHGADIVNDISAGSMDTHMLTTVATLNVPYVAMHMQGKPSTMQNHPEYRNVAVAVLQYCADKLNECRSAGIKDVIIDPGFGFGKTIEHNYSLLKNLHTFSILEAPILAGMSRKSMLYKYLERTPEAALNATSVVNTLALEQGAHILRVHDVKEASEVVKIWRKYQSA